MIEQAIAPVTHDLGDFKVRRMLPAKSRTMVGPFIFVDQFGPARLDPGRGMDVRPHPHINLATVTYLFEGAIDHRDSIGSHQRIEPGAVNLMTAGKGIVHSERSPADARAEGPHFYGMQTWLALPDGKEEIDPAFEHVGSEGLPMVESKGVSARILMGCLWGHTASTMCHSPTIYADLSLQTGKSIPVDCEADERAMLLGGQAFATPRHVFWNFVSSSRERIEQAKEDWVERRFPLVPGDEAEYIPLPEMAKTVSYP